MTRRGDRETREQDDAHDSSSQRRDGRDKTTRAMAQQADPLTADIPPAAYPMDFFCQVNHLEIGGEGTHKARCVGDIHTGEQNIQFLRCAGHALTSLNSRLSNSFDLSQKFRTLLFCQHFTNQGSQYTYILAQRLVFFGEVNLTHLRIRMFKFRLVDHSGFHDLFCSVVQVY